MVNKTEEWVLGPENTPFFTTTVSDIRALVAVKAYNQWAPSSGQPTAYALFVHGELFERPPQLAAHEQDSQNTSGGTTTSSASSPLSRTT